MTIIRLEKPLRRRVTVRGKEYVVTITGERIEVRQLRHRSPLFSPAWCELFGVGGMDLFRHNGHGADSQIPAARELTASAGAEN